MSAKKPPSLLHLLAALVILVLAAVFGLEPPTKNTKADNHQEVYLPPVASGSDYNWPEYVFSEPLKDVYPARVTRIVDGDTMDVLLANSAEARIRFSSIDAPERGQPFGLDATQVLQPFVGQQVTILQTDTDRYGRAVGFVVDQNGLNLNAAMVQAGYAWHYAKYNNDATLGQLQADARMQRLGLWQDPNAISPDQWRQSKSSSRTLSR